MSLNYSRECDIVLKPHSDSKDYTVPGFPWHDCSRKLWK